MMRDLRWFEKDPDTQLVLIWLRPLEGSSPSAPAPPYAILAASLHLFTDGDIRRVEIIP